MLVRYVGDEYQVLFVKGALYEVISVELGCYRVMTSVEDGLFSPALFEVVTADPAPPEFGESTFETFDRESYANLCGSCLRWRPDVDCWWRCEVYDRIPPAIWDAEVWETDDGDVCPDRLARPLGPLPSESQR